MPSDSGPRVLCIALDSAEGSFVRSLIDRGGMPRLARILAEGGRWTGVASSDLGSATVWPDFLGGVDAHAHGIVSEWVWDAENMRLQRYEPEPVSPFYDRLKERALVVGTIDVPFDTSSVNGFRVQEWGAHYVLTGHASAAPAVAAEAVSAIEPHPYSLGLLRHEDFGDDGSMRANAEGSIRGIALRGDLAGRLISEVRPDFALIAFQETHHGGHFLWHTGEPDHPLYSDLSQRVKYLPSGVAEIYEAADRAVGRLMDETRPESVMVIALNGMEPYRGTPDLLGRIIRRDGHSQRRAMSSRSAKERMSAMLGYAKRSSPKWVKDTYHRVTSREFQRNVAGTLLLEQLEWSATRVLELAPEEHSFIRVNLAGREGAGIVEPGDYEALVKELEEKIAGLRTHEGNPAALKVIAPNVGSANSPVPDLVVHWDHQATFPPGQIVGFPTHDLHSTNHSGHHVPRGFCVSSGPIRDQLPDRILGSDLHRPILEMFGAQPSRS